MSQPIVFDPSSDPPGPRIVTALSKIAIALKSQASAGDDGGGLTPTEVQALTLVRRTAGMDVARLSDALGLTEPAAGQVVDALEERSLVTRSRSGHEPAAVRATAQGRSAADAIVAWPDLLVEAVQILEPHEQRGFLIGLLKIIRELQERGLVPVTRMCVTCRFFRPNVHDDPERPHHCAFVDAPMGDGSLRVECDDQEPAGGALAALNWKRFVGDRPRER